MAHISACRHLACSCFEASGRRVPALIIVVLGLRRESENSLYRGYIPLLPTKNGLEQFMNPSSHKGKGSTETARSF